MIADAALGRRGRMFAVVQPFGRWCVEGDLMTFGREDVGKFELVKVAALRTAQLMRGCTPRVAGGGKPTTTAQREVACGKVASVARGVGTIATTDV